MHYRPPQLPPLPEFRVQRSNPFSAVGVDYAGPLNFNLGVLSSDYSSATPATRRQNAHTTCSGKVWVCLFTCCVTRTVHIELVTNLSSHSFLDCFRRFIARRGLPSLIISDNGTTFQSASKTLRGIMDHREVKKYMSGINIKWIFNIQRAPWWGRFFERMIQMLKRCLRKCIGQAKLSYEELLTGVAEVEAILNSRPLTYLTTDDIDERITPSHLISGVRLLSMPDHLCVQDPQDLLRTLPD